MKDKRKKLLEHFALVSDSANKKLVQYVRGYIFNLMTIYSLTKEDIALILDEDIVAVEEFLNEKWDGIISSKILIRLMLNGFECEDIGVCLAESQELFDSVDFLMSFGKKNAYKQIIEGLRINDEDDVCEVLEMINHCKELLEDKEYIKSLLEKKNGETKKI